MIPCTAFKYRFLEIARAAVGEYRQKGLHGLISRSFKWLRGVRRFHPPKTSDYESWRLRNTPSPKSLQDQCGKTRNFAYQPLFSFITPLYDPPRDVFREMLLSVRAQTYDKWEMCLVSGGRDEEIISIAESFARTDSRFRLTQLDRNLGISGNTNIALKMARGEFVVFLDHDDAVSPELLFQVAALLNRHPEADLIYYDYDSIDWDGTYCNPRFLPHRFSPEMLLSVNYLMHPVVRRSIIDEIGGLNSELDGAQDWDMVLKISEKTDHIFHIPKVLYHWRKVAGSVLADSNAKPYAFEAQKKALESHLRRTGLAEPEVVHLDPVTLRATWKTRNGRVSIILPSKDNLHLIRRCVDTILHITEYPDYEIIIVDNDSREPETLAYYQRLRQTGKVRIAPFAETFNYSRANNLGAGLATGEYLLFLNNDTKPLTRDWLNEMVRWAERPGIGVVGAKLLFPDGTIQHFGVTLGLLGPASHLFMGLEEKNGSMHGSTMWYRNVMAVTGACLLVPTPVFRGLEGFDEKYRLVYSDVDICVRAVEDGWRVVCTPFARLLHVESSTRQQETPETDYRRALKKLKPYLEQGDPCYSPNLSLLSSRPEFRAPGELDTMERIRWKLTLDGYSLRGGGSDGGSLRKK